jgi:hypothetical protein
LRRSLVLGLPLEVARHQRHAIPHAAGPTDNNFLTGVAIFTGVTGLIFLLQGSGTRSSAASFQKIVDTQSHDIAHLMEAVGSLRAMYGQIYLLLAAALLGGLVAFGLSLYKYFVG